METKKQTTLTQTKYGLVIQDSKGWLITINENTIKAVKQKILSWFGEVCSDDNFIYTKDSNGDSTIKNLKSEYTRASLENLREMVSDEMNMEIIKISDYMGVLSQN